jgi:hypothetical protein
MQMLSKNMCWAQVLFDAGFIRITFGALSIASIHHKVIKTPWE